MTTAAYSPHEPRLPYAGLKAAVATIARTHGKESGPTALRPGAVETDALHAIRATSDQILLCPGYATSGLENSTMYMYMMSE